MEAEAFRKIHPLEFYRKFLAENLRPDARTLDTIRFTAVSAGSLGTADGSTVVKLGDTSVICGVKAEVGIPEEDHPKDGKIVLNVELPPLCSPKFHKWSETEQTSHSIASLIEDIILSSSMFDLSQLCIEPQRAMWVLYIDVYCLNDDGSIFDAALTAVATALRNTKLPSVRLTDNDEVVIEPEKEKIPLTLTHCPIPLSFGILEGYILVDPSREEEELLETQFTIVINDKKQVCSVFKPGGDVVSSDTMDRCMDMATDRAQDVYGLITKACQNPVK
eukprot:gb/GECH01006264.1/.p1 GENE.gb/GECH01006264.1/~~gb/GECH01006264.1/.p1  ORF type:complete len:277 (+),score=61.46 gb/GECH01006264.1/:1-831(+)